ncbi:transmembrane protein 53-like isoform X1 [Eurytemora carolleeae]|uniref:transmembrane protein 53-like isoform X1 n=1 Tax=Eurytemora carolleeae TaxID=1294199 RepID=UPI000C7755B7|nr:transmembrane protein 53-like isoform X1 [Eurytemora carolleeae]|eukprot:XP_023333025.1 transmembrane protein 53-like isoform X1 [Eurytemora affinis]
MNYIYIIRHKQCFICTVFQMFRICKRFQVLREPGVRFLSSEMLIWRNEAAERGRISPTVVLFGYAGSPKSHLEKYETLYTSLGYNSVCCILPHKELFAYNIPEIQKCAEKVLSVIESSGAQNIVAHCFSNNGIALYQQTYTILNTQKRAECYIKGLILDSGPGPMGLRDNVLKRIFNDKQGRIFLPIALFFVNAANKIPFAENIKSIIEQCRSLKSNFKENSHVPWTGLFMKTQEKGTWPVLFLYSKADTLMPWKYVAGVVQRLKPHRTVYENRFEKSGHVAHFKTYPEEYTAAIKKFLNSI